MSESTLLDWPAFSSRKFPTFEKIPYERGVWGKVPGAPTDFRWICRSSGLEHKELAEQISLGTEDQPAKAQLWLRHGDRYYAAGLYESRAWDASGRTGFLEKQVLSWRRPSGTPAALGALLLLSHVASLNADIWWPRREDPAWSETDFFLQLAAEELEPRLDNLESAVRRGVEDLHEAVERKNLGNLYAQILAGRKPAYLTGLTKPPSPLALAVLLLPLPRELADAISLAGWIPSNRAPLENLGARWDVIVLPPFLGESVRVEDLNPEEKRQGWDFAEALLELDPELAQISAMPLALPKSAGMTPPALPPVEQPRLQGGPALTPIEALRPGARIVLPVPPPGASDLLKELHSFACAVDRRWLDLDRWTGHPAPQLETIPETLFPSWIATLQQQKPQHVDDEQWTVKLDLLRSAALVLCPRADTLRTVGLPKSGRIPALLFSLLVSKHLLGEMEQDILRQALQHSLSLKPNPWTRRLENEFVEWPPSKKRAWLKHLIQKELDAARSARS